MARKIKKKVKLLIYGFILLLILSIYTILTSTIFELKEIEIIGNKNLSKEDIFKISSINLSENLFKYKLNKIENNIKQNPYVKNVKVKRKLPNTIYINIEEYSEDANIHTGNSYITINNNGRILSERESLINNDIPVITNLDIEDYKIGSNIRLSDNNIKTKLLNLLDSIDNNNLKRDINSIEVNNREVRMINDDNIKISMNLDDNIVYNMKRLSLIIVDLKTKNMKNGNLDLRNTNQSVYSPL